MHCILYLAHGRREWLDDDRRGVLPVDCGALPVGDVEDEGVGGLALPVLGDDLVGALVALAHLGDLHDAAVHVHVRLRREGEKRGQERSVGQLSSDVNIVIGRLI